MTARPGLACILTLALVATGCLSPGSGGDGGDGTGTQTGTGTGPPLPDCTPQTGPEEPQRNDTFDGQAALAWVEAIVYAGPGELRPRIPVDPEATCTAAWLGRALDVPGWDVGFSNFTAAEYMDIPKEPYAERYTDGCSAEDMEELEGAWMHNVYATRAGGDRTLMLAAHWDQKEDASDGGVVPGANDGASGMGLLLEFQRHVVAAGITFPFDIVVAFFDGEDGFADCHPLAGSIHFAHTMPVGIDRMILLDMVGDRDARFPQEGFSVESDPALVELIWEWAAPHGLEENFVETQRDVIDDHRPFIDAGVPSVDIIDFMRTGFPNPNNGFPPYWHTTEDTPDKLDAGMLRDMGRLLLSVLQDERFVESWPDGSGG